MEIFMYLAALLLVVVTFAHSYLGERYILIRLFKHDNLPKLFGSDDFTKKTLRFAWHVTSFAWLGLAAILVALAQPDLSKHLIGKIIAITFAIHFLIALFGSKGKHLSWVVFGLVSVLVWFGISI
ncbi:conserved hypothetical protein [Vibrio nigripulchritudo SFn27]|uniref:Uncharacterized protein n=1 Tax=Vibrio nigripulchritudo TaxID=28173 RepID=U4KBK6_9VIBR|nr:hypothetical protein [Vibrio nigripulchritudo]CCN82504.1 conserved hypothetical protein [Vibrio nigripulchritudo BLFn1]CCN91491.1 conserved hypothetical protein [Vibrio nigripulchritudo SFn27]CCN97656.1 conserved hypothetical protein [Vibrio nigripulchritudo ENn2]CCO38798.1 conserved hypothetical protein [Vibrio nigripulchritudo SFn135]CCO55204.1 conserved hypothetical protein [Vibrio nigripulchritudo Wn13]